MSTEQQTSTAPSTIISHNATTVPANTTSQLIQFNPASQLPLKLTGSSNFTTWKAQVSTLMHGHDLFSHLDGLTSAPPKTITQNDTTVENPLYKVWFRQDQVIQNALMASVDSTLASQVASASTSKMAWDSLHTSFANKSQTRIFSIRDMLSKISKESKTIAEYLRDIRSIADELATAGALVSNEELIVKILNRLGSEFRDISAAIRACEAAISYEELFDKLVDHELFLKHEELKKGPSNNITAAIAQRNSNANQSSRSNKRWPQPSNWRKSQQAQNQPNLNTNNQQQWCSPPVQCQLCEKYGHIA